MIKNIFLIAMSIPTLLLAAPENPSNLQLQALSKSSVSIDWQDNSSDETGFKIFRDDVLIMTTLANVHSYVDTGLEASTAYTYTVKATDEDTIAPEITLNGNAIIGLNMGGAYTEQGASSIDTVDGDISADIVISGAVDTTYAGLYILTYTSVDAAGNSASISRRVHVYSDNVGDTMIVDPNRNNLYVNLHDSTPAGAYYSFEDDNFVAAGQQVLVLHSTGIENSFHILGYETDVKYNWASLPSHQNRFHVSWDSKFSGNFIIYVVLKFKTAEGVDTWSDLVYTPSENGYANYTENFMHIYLGESADDGTWHHFERDILADLHTFYPGATIDNSNSTWDSYVNGIAIRGSGSVTNIKLSE